MDGSAISDINNKDFDLEKNMCALIEPKTVWMGQLWPKQNVRDDIRS